MFIVIMIFCAAFRAVCNLPAALDELNFQWQMKSPLTKKKIMHIAFFSTKELENDTLTRWLRTGVRWMFVFFIYCFSCLTLFDIGIVSPYRGIGVATLFLLLTADFIYVVVAGHAEFRRDIVYWCTREYKRFGREFRWPKD